MSIKMVRQPSETPNITNIDDIIPFRYAYGNQNGYVKDKGNEIGYVINGSQFTIQSGRLVLQGVEADISASGVTIEIDSVNETRYYALYLQVNLALNTVSIQSQYDTADYPTISSGDDLTENSSGIANLVLYHFTANNGVISNVEKIVQEISYPLEDYDISKGTVEERLTSLGFRQGELTIDTTMLDSDVSITLNILQRQGNYVIGDLAVSTTSTEVGDIYTLLADAEKCFNIPIEFRPPANTSIPATIYYAVVNTSTFQAYYTRELVNLTVTSDGYIPILSYRSLLGNEYYYVKGIRIHFGYEASPIS